MQGPWAQTIVWQMLGRGGGEEEGVNEEKTNTKWTSVILSLRDLELFPLYSLLSCWCGETYQSEEE